MSIDKLDKKQNTIAYILFVVVINHGTIHIRIDFELELEFIVKKQK